MSPVFCVLVISFFGVLVLCIRPWLVHVETADASMDPMRRVLSVKYVCLGIKDIQFSVSVNTGAWQ